jgi:hypothetical protein
MIQHFDRAFEDSRNEMIQSHPPNGCLVEQLRSFLDEASATR